MSNLRGMGGTSTTRFARRCELRVASAPRRRRAVPASALVQDAGKRLVDVDKGRRVQLDRDHACASAVAAWVDPPNGPAVPAPDAESRRAAGQGVGQMALLPGGGRRRAYPWAVPGKNASSRDPTVCRHDGPVTLTARASTREAR